MKQKLLVLLAAVIGFASAVQASPRIVTICLTNSYGEQASLKLTAIDDNTYDITGGYDYTIFGGYVWKVKGVFYKNTGQMKFKAINPYPDRCTYWADFVTFDYTYTSNGNFKGSFTNNCGNFGDLDASEVKGDCGFRGLQLPKGEYGGTGSHTMHRTQMALPKGEDLHEILKDSKIKVTPNPAVSSTNITFELSSTVQVQAAIYNQYGTLVYTLANTTLNAGSHTLNWNLQTLNGTKAQQGVYWIKITSTEGVKSERIVVSQ